MELYKVLDFRRMLRYHKVGCVGKRQRDSDLLMWQLLTDRWMLGKCSLHIVIFSRTLWQLQNVENLSFPASWKCFSSSDCHECRSTEDVCDAVGIVVSVNLQTDQTSSHILTVCSRLVLVTVMRMAKLSTIKEFCSIHWEENLNAANATDKIRIE